MSGNRRAVAFLSMQHVARMLALPDGLRAVACRDDFMRNGVAVLIEGDALDDQPDGIELPRLPVEASDPSALARQATVRAEWCNDGTAELMVGCPAGTGCPWIFDTRRYEVTLTLIIDAVQQHLTEAHA